MRRLLFFLLIKQAVFCSLDYGTEDQIKRQNGELEVDKEATENSSQDSDVIYLNRPKTSKYLNPDSSNQKQTEDKLDTVAAKNDLKSPVTRSDRIDPPNFEDFISKPTEKSADKNGKNLDEILKLMSHSQLHHKNSEPTRKDEPLNKNAKPNATDDSEEQGGNALFRSALPEHKILEANRRYQKHKEMLKNSYMKGVSDVQRSGYMEGATDLDVLKRKLGGANDIDWMLNNLQQEHLDTPLADHGNAIPNQTPYIEPSNRAGEDVYGPSGIQPPCGSMICSNPLLEAPIVHTRAHEARNFLTGIPVANMGVFHRPVHRTVFYG